MSHAALPEVRGSYRLNAPLAVTNWFGVGGPAEVLFKPADTEDLAAFLTQVSGSRFEVADEPKPNIALLKPETRNLKPLPITVIGVGSNLIVRDGGIDGVVIRLGRGFTQCEVSDEEVIAGAALLDVHLARFAADAGRAGLEFMVGIPGTVGGALAMNGGAYGRETKDVLIKAEAVTREGEIVMLGVDEMRYTYRHYGGPEGLIFTRAWFRTAVESAQTIGARLAEIQTRREATQPIRERTGGSTFKNPPGHKAWELIDAAGCRGLRLGGAMMSELHCNFMINTGNATAAELEALGEEVRARVLQKTGISLEWEIRRVGKR